MTAVGSHRALSLGLAGVAGALFGAGLLVSGMTDPARVLGFLDVTGSWDPTLGFVMAGAILVHATAIRWIQRSPREPWFDTAWHLPSRGDIDRPLVLGSAIFGVGWGLAGLCPGPGIVAAAGGNLAAMVFVATMLVGMLVARLTKRA